MKLKFYQTQQCNSRQQLHSLPLNPIEVPSRTMVSHGCYFEPIEVVLMSYAGI